MGEEDGNALLVTELVDGSTLAELNRDGTLSDREIGEIGADLCEALDHAHTRAVVHRDIKPQNVLVTEEGEPRAKLMDFGVARLTDAAALTAPGDVVGTLAYMAPEQAEGRTAGPEADVYSLAPDAVRVLERRAPDPPRDAGGDGAGDRRPPAAAAPAAPRPAARALRRPSTPACRPARIAARRWRSWASAIEGSLDRLADQPPARRARPVPAPRRDRRSPPRWAPGSPSVTASCSRRISSRSSRHPSAGRAREKEPLISVLRNLESRIEGLVEGVFSRAFSSEVQPVELARKLAKEMDAHKTAGVARVYVPNEYTVYLSSKDRAKLEGYERSLEQELSGYLLEHARRRDYDLLTRPAVEFKTDERLRLGEFGIQTRLVKPPAHEGEAPQPGGGGPHDGLLGGAKSAAPRRRAPSSARKRWSPPARSSRSTTAATCSRARGRRSAAPSGAECVLADPNVSRRHAELRRSPTGDWTIADLGSTNGIKVNGRRVSSTRLSPGDQVTVGTTTFLFDIEQ